MVKISKELRGKIGVAARLWMQSMESGGASHTRWGARHELADYAVHHSTKMNAVHRPPRLADVRFMEIACYLPELSAEEGDALLDAYRLDSRDFFALAVLATGSPCNC